MSSSPSARPASATGPGKTRSGFVLIDESNNAVAFNHEALQILTYPQEPGNIESLNAFLTSKIQRHVLKRLSSDPGIETIELISGRRHYLCRVASLQGSGNGTPKHTAVLLYRKPPRTPLPAEVAAQFGLTRREQEVVTLLFEGLTTNEIATRMHISANTVKSFVRLVMMKLGASSRAGILCKIAVETT
ncbi:MAG TPA: LuxR C-terminal-related transcriptional regulator [Terriglobales bacterium]|nr:LuxR C-terminal-related transcriptional regulator [Terriglobales bacterium]